LESLGCIEFIANPGHKRSDLVQITERGKSWLRAGLEQEAKVLELICSEFTENEVAGSERLLRRLRKALEAKKTSREQPIRKASRPREEGTTVGKGEEAGRREPDPAPASAEEEQENELPVSLL
jgi:DNA-binding PadR family transcriptional regulator